MGNESNNKFISSRGIMKLCDYHSLTPISSINCIYNYPDFNNFTNKFKDTSKIPLIYMCSSCLLHFENAMLPHIPFKFILISGDCDEDMPNDIFKTSESLNNFINNDKIVHWFCQNWIGTHEKVTLMPIGMDYHTMQTRNIFWGPRTNSNDQELLLNKLREKMKPFWDREIKCYSNFHFATTTKHGYDRIDAIENIPRDLVYYEPTQLKRLLSWNKQINYTFVISPHGGGFDCHRMWEALLLGCIVIVKTSNIDKLYHDLPVLIVNEWKDINKDLLNKTVDDFKNKKFNYEKLELNYWKDKFYNI